MVDTDDTTVSTPVVDNGTGDQPAVTEPTVLLAKPDDGEPQEPQEPQLEDKILNKFQSWQGRREKELKEEIFSGMADLLNQQAQQFQSPSTPDFSGMSDDPEPDPEVDVKAWIRWDQRQQQKQVTTVQQANERTYFTTLNNSRVRHPDAEVHQAVLKEIQHNQNLDPYGQPINPAADAMLNYNNALRMVMEKRLAPQDTVPITNPLANNQPPLHGLGVSQPGSPGGTPPASSMPKNLSPEARKFIAHSGWNAEKVRKSLSKGI